jgi:hypothetical protein
MDRDLVAAFANKTASEVLQALGGQLYRPPLSDLRDRLPELPAALRVPWLIIDFDTELLMNGILGFVGNRPHALDGTIEALHAIGAQATATTLKGIRALATQGGLDDDAVRNEVAARGYRQLYPYLPPEEREDIFGLLERFVADNMENLLRAIRSCAETGSR